MKTTIISFSISFIVLMASAAALEAKWTYPVNIGFSTPAIADIDADGAMEIIAGSSDGTIYALDSKGGLLWKFETGGPIHASIHADDIDNDGDKEILAASRDGNVYAIDQNGILKWKFTAGRMESTPAITDINGDGRKEIFFGSYDGNVYSLDSSGGVIWKEPVRLGMPTGIRASPLLVDLDGDGIPEVVIPARTQRLYVFDAATGELLWTYRLSYDIDASPSAGDLDGDGGLEIITSGGETLAGIGDTTIYALKNGGSLLWKYKAGGGLDSSPSIGDLDGDGRLEVVESTLLDGAVYALNSDGTLRWKYAADSQRCCTLNNEGVCVYAEMSCKIYSTPILADIDSDGRKEVLAGSDNGILSIIGHDGRRLDSFQTGGSIRGSPLLGDVDNDGLLEVIVGSDKLYVLGTGKNGGEWTMFKRDPSHTGNAEGLAMAKKAVIKNAFAGIELALSIAYGDTIKSAACYYQSLLDRLYLKPHMLGLFC